MKKKKRRPWTRLYPLVLIGRSGRSLY